MILANNSFVRIISSLSKWSSSNSTLDSLVERTKLILVDFELFKFISRVGIDVRIYFQVDAIIIRVY